MNKNHIMGHNSKALCGIKKGNMLNTYDDGVTISVQRNFICKTCLKIHDKLESLGMDEMLVRKFSETLLEEGEVSFNTRKEDSVSIEFQNGGYNIIVTGKVGDPGNYRFVGKAEDAILKFL